MRCPRLAFSVGLFVAASTLACRGGDGSALDQGARDQAAPDLGDPSGDAGSDASVVALDLPALVRLPYVEAGAGDSSAMLQLTNLGGVSLALSFELAGDALLSIAGVPPASVAPDESVAITLAFAGSATQHVALATLRVTSAAGVRDVRVVAVAGAAGLPSATYAPVLAAGGGPCGEGTTVALPTAPFPHVSGVWTDPSVRVFVPAGYRQTPDHDVVLHFHGHSTTLAATLAAHRYEQHVCASGVNALLVVPQGPVNAASGNFGELMTPAGTQALLDQVLVLLYRDGRVDVPVRGELTLTAHSGGYRAVAANANAAALRVRGVHLYDALYGDIAAFTTYAAARQRFRSNYTASGGTLSNNQTFADTLASDHPSVTLSEDATLPALLDVDSVIDFTPATHNGATRYQNAYGDRVRFGSRRGVLGGRVELRSALGSAGSGTVTFLAPADEERVGFVVEASAGGGPFVQVAEVGTDARSASFPLSGGASLAVRVRARFVDRSVEAGTQALLGEPSDTYALSADADVLVVDGFERVLGGSFGGRAHDFAARVGLPLSASSVSHRALVEDGFSIAGYSAVIWLAGDQSLDDEVLRGSQRALLSAYLDAGGALVVSGSEVAFALGGGAFLAELGATYISDDAGSTTFSAEDALGIALSNVSFGGALAPYEEDYPDVLGVTGAGSVLLRYGTGGAAAVGIAGRAALVGFPLEVIESDAELGMLSGALLRFVEGP